MAEEDKDSKTEPASPKRVRETEEKGQFANSKEFTSTFILMAAIAAFTIAGRQSTLQMMGTWRFFFSEAYAAQLTPEELLRLLKLIFDQVFKILAPILLTFMAAGIIANLLQTQGLKFSLNPLAPKFNKLNPIKGVTRLFSKNSVVELIKSIFKISVLGFIGYSVVKGRFDQIPGLGGF
ncbi:MAG: EscU/YscU/HrcU family type III secretion system export apparatus switch protein, partial [Nitrospinales bacterium]